MVDVVRGFSVVSMVLFHLCYDLKYLRGDELPWFSGELQTFWRASISWSFLLVAGCMFAFSRNNWKRAGRLLALAAAIYVSTSVAGVDTPISFGVIFCLGGSTLVACLLDKLGLRPNGIAAAAVLFLAFIYLLELPSGHVGAGIFESDVPAGLYQGRWLSWVGLPGPEFASGDYYPLIPYTLIYLVGVALGGYLKHDAPKWMKNWGFKPLEIIGQNALAVYIIHQPLLVLLLGLA